MGANAAQSDEAINRPEKVITWHMILQGKLVEQRCLRFLSWAHHRSIVPPVRKIETATYAPIKQEFFNTIDRLLPSNR